MFSSTAHNGNGCGGVRELIAWYPGRSLEDDERRRVEEHVAECSACADLLQFTSDLKGVVMETYSPHPDADALVCFVEDKASVDPEQRSAIEEHLAKCADCSEQAAMLEAVDLDDVKISSSFPDPREATAGSVARRRGFWDSLVAGLFKPIPAAVYLTVAVLAVGLHLLRAGGWMGGTGESGIRSGPGVRSGVLGNVVIMPDETDRVRQPSGEETTAIPVDVSKTQYLLLELTGLENPPRAEDSYTVEISRKSPRQPALTSVVEGRAFLENYTICFTLEAGTLTPGEYVVRVVGPGGETVFRSSLDVQ